MPEPQAVLQMLQAWAETQPAVRALLLTSSRTAPGAPVDALSDYDLIVAVNDPPGIQPYFDSRDWLEAFGRVLVLYRDPIKPWFDGQAPDDRCFAYITQFDRDGLKLDLTVMPATLLRRIAGSPLDPDLDLGYQVLLDKDGLTAGMPPPTHRAFIPLPPDQQSYLQEVELFFHETTYLAKYLWRDDLLPARSMLQEAMLQGHLLPMLIWHIQSLNGWRLRFKAHGRGLKKVTPPELWAELEQLSLGGNAGENWAVLWQAVDLYLRLAKQVGAHLGFAFPQRLVERCLAYLSWVQALPAPAAPANSAPGAPPLDPSRTG
ncbi:MAG: aminoglycoside 6-adenylyltransferase [Chloroflexota bacterium]